MLLHQTLSCPGALPFPRLSRCRESRRKNPKRLPSYISPCVSLQISTDTVFQVAENKVLVGAFVSAVIGQVSKPFTSVLLYGNKFELNFSWITRSGGFPSAHSSAVVATATSLGLERGFSDSIFGLAVVYAGIVMYDAQISYMLLLSYHIKVNAINWQYQKPRGVRREVGNQARVINRHILPKAQGNPCLSNDADNLIETSSSSHLERPDPLYLQEPSSKKPLNNTSLLNRIDERTDQTMSTIVDVKEGSGDFVHGYAPLKESVGHTEIEVLAGAILGFLVSLIIHTT